MELVVSLTVVVLAAVSILYLVNEDAYVGDGVLDALCSAVVIVHSHFEVARAKIKGVL